ncbi:MAG: hypothetical protein QG628_318 [Patescibacteria group bacterium]|nr:hypothetical protein [Patescibacteria group bacterium]
MDKKFYQHFSKFLHSFNVMIPLTIAIVASIVCVFALRANNLKALELRDNVVAVDKQNGDIEAALRELRTFVYGHMNTNLSSGPNAIKPPIQLKYRYERLVTAEQDRLSAENSKVYTQAQAICEQRFPKGLSGSGRIPCITEYVASQGVKQNTIPDSLYKFDFVSPSWSPDLAGWSLVIASVAFAVFVVQLILDRWVKAELRDT